MSEVLEDRAADIVIHDEEMLSDGFWRVFKADVTLRDPSGDVRFMREVLDVGKVAVVLPYDPVRDEVVLLRQYRHAAQIATGSGDLVETVAGLVDPGETVEVAARRELGEEVGLTASALHFLIESLPAAGVLTEHTFTYVARVDAAALPARCGLASEAEIIRPFAVDAGEAIEAAFAGRFRNAHTLLALMAFSRRRAGLRQAWR